MMSSVMMENRQSDRSSSLNLRGKLEEKCSLARFNKLESRWCGRCFVSASRFKGLAENFLDTLDDSSPVTWLGRGTNVLIRDGGIRGVVIVMHHGMNALKKLDKNLIRAEVGVPCAKLARSSADFDMQGAEFLAGIPGTVGGALAMNSGAYGSETWDHVRRS